MERFKTFKAGLVELIFCKRERQMKRIIGSTRIIIQPYGGTKKMKSGRLDFLRIWEAQQLSLKVLPIMTILPPLSLKVGNMEMEVIG